MVLYGMDPQVGQSLYGGSFSLWFTLCLYNSFHGYFVPPSKKFQSIHTMGCTIWSRINKWDLIKLQSFCKAKDTVNKPKRQLIDLEKIFTNPKSDRGLISNIYKKLKKLDFREPNNPIKNGAQS